MKPSPPGWPRLSSCLYYTDPAAAIDFLERAFGFETRLCIEGEGGAIVHSELVYGDAVVMVGGDRSERGPDPYAASPRAVGGRNTQSLFLYVDDVDAHCAQARAAGATVLMEPRDSDYGEEYWADRSYEALDLEGHRWWFSHRVRTGGRP